MAKRGRKPAYIDKKTFEALCHIQCTEEEICAVLDVDIKTLIKWCKETYGMNFSKIFQQKREGGKTSLRRKQWHLADTSAAMAIFLGKNMLGQRDKWEVEGDVTVYPVFSGDENLTD